MYGMTYWGIYCLCVGVCFFYRCDTCWRSVYCVKAVHDSSLKYSLSWIKETGFSEMLIIFFFRISAIFLLYFRSFRGQHPTSMYKDLCLACSISQARRPRFLRLERFSRVKLFFSVVTAKNLYISRIRKLCFTSRWWCFSDTKLSCWRILFVPMANALLCRVECFPCWRPPSSPASLARPCQPYG